MRFNLEPGGAFCDGKNELVTVKINDKEKINLPYTSYIFDEHRHFIISNFKVNPTNSILTDFSQSELYLKLEKVESDYKLVLVDHEDQEYYYVYYNDTNIVKIATFSSIPTSCMKYQGQYYILSYDGECSVNFVPLINSRVLVDPKDIMSNQDIDSVLKELKKLPDERLIIGVGRNFLRGPEEVLSSTYKSAEVYGVRGNKIGILNNIATSFSNKKLELFSGDVSIDTIDKFGANLSLKKTNPRFEIKRLNNGNYVGCILSEYGKCERFYALTPGSFEQGEYAHTDYDDEEEFDQQTHYLYAYYYYLHDLEVTMSSEKLEQRIEHLERIVKNLNNAMALVPGLKGEPGERGMRGLPGCRGQKGEPGELVWDSRPGEKGERGFPGPKGEHGIMGHRGDKGETGPIGPPGIPGLDGVAGEPGTPGQKGNKGDTPNAQEIATKLVTSKKAELVEAVLNTKGIIGKNLTTQIADKINIHLQGFVNKIDVVKFTEGVVNKLSLEEAKNIVKDAVSKVTSDATKKNNPDSMACNKYENFAEKLAELLVRRSSMSKKEAENLVKDKVSNWGLAKYLLIHSDLNEQIKALETVKKEINEEKLIQYLLEYAQLKGNASATKTIIENIVHQFLDTKKVGELGRAVLEAKDNQGKKILVNDLALQKGVAEELRKNPGEVQGPKGGKGDIGPKGLDGAMGIRGDRGEKGEIGSKGEKGAPGANGLQGPKGSDGLPGSKGDLGPKGDIGAPGVPGLKGDQGNIGFKGDTGSKGDKGRDTSPEEVAQKLINNGTIANQVLEYRDQGGDLVLEKQVVGRIISNQDIQTGIAITLADNRMEELADVLLRGANHTLVEKLANNTKLTQSISEELRKNPGEVQGPKGGKGDIGPKGLDGAMGIRGDRGEKGEIGSKGEKGAPGANGLQGPKGSDGLPGSKGDLGPKGDIGAPGVPGLKGDQGNIGFKGDTGSKGDKGRDTSPEEVAQKLINNGTIANQVLEYRDQGGDLVLEKQVVGRIISNQDIQTGIAITLADNRMEELADVLLRGANHTLVEKLANNTKLTQSISEELRKNPGEVQGPKGGKGDIGPKGLDGAMGIRGDRGEKGEIGSKGEKGAPGANGLQGPKGSDGLPGSKGDLGPKGDIGAPGVPGLKGDQGNIGFKGDTGSKGDKGRDTSPEEVAQKLINNGTIANQVLEYRDQGGDLVLEKQVVGRIISNQDIQTGIAITLADNRMEELADVLLRGANHTLVEKLANNTKLTQSISEELRKNPGEVQGPKGGKGDIGPKGLDGAMGIRGDRGEKGEIGSKGEKGAPGANGLQGPKGSDGLPGPKGEIGLQGPKGQVGGSGLKGSKGDTGLTGIPGPKGEDGIGAALADKFLYEIKKVKNETLNAKDAAEVAKNALESFAKEAKNANNNIIELHNKTENFTKKAEVFCNASKKSASDASVSESNTQTFYSQTQKMFCIIQPDDKSCVIEKRNKREMINSPVTSGASRPTSFISQVINFFYPVAGQDEYKIKNEIQEVAKIIDAADIVTKFEEVLGATAVKCGISKKSLNFDPVELQSTIINNSLSNDKNHNELLKLLCVAAKKSFPDYKQTGKCLAIFKDHMEKRLNEQQRAFVNTENIVANNEQPRSFMSYVSPPSSLSAINQQVVGYLR